MKNQLTLLLAIFFMGSISPLFGQVSVGVRGGVSFGSLSLQNQVLDNKTIANPSISLPVEIRLSKLAAIQPEFNLHRQSGTLSRSLSSLSSSGTAAFSEQTCQYDVDFVQAPILIKISPSQKRFSADVFWGPSIGIALRGTENSTLVSTFEGGSWTDSFERDLEIGGELSEVRKVQWSFIVGGALNYRMKGSRLVVDVRHQVSLDHVASISDEGKVAHQGTTVSFGYMVDLTR
ncbi:MAG: outer membrane beta-barrel protein [Bacteroidota bacterium]